MRPDSNFWQGKRVLLTGHTGFKGAWLALWLSRLGAQVTGVALPPSTTPNLYSLAEVNRFCTSNYCDIRDSEKLRTLVCQAQPEVVFHLAAQPLVRASYLDPLATFSSNVMGTAHLLDALRHLESVRAAVLITTDKVYQNREWSYPYRENDALGGHDPYSASKAACELVINSYRESFLSAQGVATASARAGNVIAGGDWSADRLIPDAIRAWQSGTSLEVRRPNAVRPWQHVLDPLYGYIRLAEALWHQPELSGAYNFGPSPLEVASVRSVINQARQAYGSGTVIYHDALEGPHEAGLLSLDPSHTYAQLGIKPLWSLSEAVNRTVNWYTDQHAGQNALALCEADIKEYEATA